MAINFSQDRKSTRLNSSHITISYAVFCLKKTADVEVKCPDDQPRSAATLALCARAQPLPRITAVRTPRARVPPRLRLDPSFFFNDTATTEIYTLSLHDALPI